MSFRSFRGVQRPTRRQVRNQLAGFDALAHGTTPVFEAPRAGGGRGRQPESAVNDAAKQWARELGGVLYRNRRGMVDLPNGGRMPYGLGPNGFGDNVGYLPVTITPEMVGRTIAVFTMVESKVRGGADDHQQTYIEEVCDAGGISGVATCAEDCERIFTRWRNP